jgi:hypothetical protein
MPLFNKEPYVARAVNSILRQTYEHFEILVIDDGSTDGGAEIVRRLPDRRIRLISQTNSGPGAARNRGIAEARAEFVAFLDADDCWLPFHLANGISRLKELGPRVAAISSGYMLFPQGATTEAMWRSRGLANGVVRIDRDTPAQLVVHLLAYMSPCTTIARTDVVRRYGGFFSKDKCVYGEDSFLWLKVLLNETVAFQLGASVEVHSEASSLSNTKAKSRPVEPLLKHSADLFAACPTLLLPLLREVLMLRAVKTASVLGYWGSWRQGRQLLHEFVVPGSPGALRFATAQICASPVGSALGAAWRSFTYYGSRFQRGRQ